MNFGQLDSYIRDLRQSGFDTMRLRVALWHKLAYPLIAIVMAVLAIPFALSMGRRGSLTGIAVAIAVALAYWVVERTIRRHGQRQLLARGDGGVVVRRAVRPCRRLSAPQDSDLRRRHREARARPFGTPRHCSYNRNMFRELGPLLSYMRRYRWGYLWGTLSCIATNIAAVQGPRILKKAIDELERGVSRERIVFLAGVFVAIYLVKGIFLYAQRWILIGISREIEFDLRNDLFLQLEHQDSNFYQQYRTGDIMARMTNDLNAVRMLLGPALMYSANTIFFTVGALFFLLRISPWLTLVAWAPMPLASILVQYFGRKIHNRFERIQESFSEISSQAQENYSGARLVRAFAREESQMSLFERLNRQYITRAQGLVQLMGMLWPTLEFILGIAMIITLLVGGHEVIAHRITPGEFVAFNTYMILLIWPIIAVGWVVNIFQRGTASVEAYR